LEWSLFCAWFIGRLTVLVLAFDSMSLRAVCEDAAQANTELGPAVAEALRHRLADLRAATSPADLIAGSPRVLHVGAYEYMSVNLTEGFRMVFAPNHVKNPRDAANGIDWTKVSRIKIIEIARCQP
jgi:toxin HigB-1